MANSNVIYKMESLRNLCKKRIADIIDYFDLESLIGILPRSIVDEILELTESDHKLLIQFDLEFEYNVYLQINK